MRIDRIRMLGFKSFAGKTEIELDPGITAIVGPNGCGKSNVIDAVKWVLGEQRPSSLRAKEMMDVIFAGSEKQKPVGMAEVAIHLDNEDGVLSVGQPEVVLTRRLFRSGESEYLLNGKACRLKDLRDVLMDTGSGLDAFSIMEQGKIDAILAANPTERRTIFEDAAGIGRYKARRKETLRRLDRIADDLTRLRDVIELTEKQLRSLRYQASRASKHREHVDSLRKKRVTWALYRYHALLAEQSRLTEELSGVESEEARVNESLRSLLGELSGEESGFDRLTNELSAAEGDLFRVDSEIRSAKERSGHGRRMAAELEDRVRAYESEIGVTEHRLEEYAQEKENLAVDLTALAAETGLRESEQKRSEARIKDARGGEAERGKAIRDVSRRREDALTRATRVRNERATLTSVLRSGEMVRERMAKRVEAIDAERLALTSSRGALTTDHAEKLERETEVRARLDAADTEVTNLEDRLRDLSGQAASVDNNLSGWRSRLEVLANLKARREGMHQSVKRILEEAEREDSTLSGILGVVADLVKVEGPDASAVELAIGGCAQGIVTETLGDALEAIEFLKREKLGRALFLPLSELRDAGPVYGEGGEVRPALSGARAVGGHDALLSALLSDSVIVSDVDIARRIAGNGGRSLRIITGGGEVLGRIGNISGGAGVAAGAALLTRNAEIEELSSRISGEEEKRAALEEALGLLSENYRDLRAESKTLREEVEIAARDSRDAENRLGRSDRDLSRLDDETHVLDVEAGEIETEREEAAASAERLDQAMEELRVEEEALRAESASLDATLAEAREAARAAERDHTELSVALARARERLKAAEDRAAAIDRSMAEARRSLELAAVEAENCRLRRDEARLESETADQEAVRAEKEKEGCHRKVSEARRKHREAREKLLSRREDAEGLRDEHEKYRTALEDFRLRENETRMKLEGLIERIGEEYELDLADLYEGFIPEEIDWEALDAEVTDLKRKIDRMGNVNMEAIDQLTEGDERVTFLNTEEKDLITSREQLLEILRKVNRESRERFEKAFAEIRDHFRVMYRKLFGGGAADILLTEGCDILEAGIEIVCRPPGRELQNLNLLSGGEKTLTAVALLFAIFRARPSPFALMDEVDAALDESNIDRFLTVLREFTEESQFIIITHNKRTMAEADALYGMSMPEPGVSQPMSIRFERNPGRNGNGTGNSSGNSSGNSAGEAAEPVTTGASEAP